MPSTSCRGAVVAVGYNWLDVGSVHVPIELRADAMTGIMLAMVTGVSLLVAVFGSGYMHHDPGYPRFFAAVSGFVFSMCMLVLSSSYLMLFVFWEAVGVCSLPPHRLLVHASRARPRRPRRRSSSTGSGTSD